MRPEEPPLILILGTIVVSAGLIITGTDSPASSPPTSATFLPATNVEEPDATSDLRPVCPGI